MSIKWIIIGVVVIVGILLLTGKKGEKVSNNNEESSLSPKFEENDLSIGRGNFKSILRKEGASRDIVQLSLRIIEHIQREEGVRDKSTINHDVLERLNDYRFSDVLHEREYKKLYKENPREINEILEERDRSNRIPDRKDREMTHIRTWSEEAQKAEMAVTYKIKDSLEKVWWMV